MKKIKKYLPAFVATILLFPICGLAQNDSSLWGLFPSAGMFGNARSELVLVNDSNQYKSVYISFNEAFSTMGRVIAYPELSINGLRKATYYRLVLSPKKDNIFEIRDNNRENLFEGWCHISGTEGDGNVLSGVSGKLRRFIRVGDEEIEYTSPLSRWGNEFKFEIKEGDGEWNAIVIQKDSGGFAPGELVLELLDSDGRRIALRSYVFWNQTQDVRFLWQHFVGAPELWRKIVGNKFSGFLRVSASGWPFTAVLASEVKEKEEK